jgi:hypothetical protein
VDLKEGGAWTVDGDPVGHVRIDPKLHDDAARSVFGGAGQNLLDGELEGFIP